MARTLSASCVVVALAIKINIVPLAVSPKNMTRMVQERKSMVQGPVVVDHAASAGSWSIFSAAGRGCQFQRA